MKAYNQKYFNFNADISSSLISFIEARRQQLPFPLASYSWPSVNMNETAWRNRRLMLITFAVKRFNSSVDLRRCFTF